MGSSDGAAAIPCLHPEAFTDAKGFGKFAGIRRYDTIVGTIDAFKKLLPTGLSPQIKSVTAEDARVVDEFEGKDRTGGVKGKSVAVRVGVGGGRINQTKNK